MCSELEVDPDGSPSLTCRHGEAHAANHAKTIIMRAISRGCSVVRCEIDEKFENMKKSRAAGQCLIIVEGMTDKTHTKL